MGVRSGVGWRRQEKGWEEGPGAARCPATPGTVARHNEDTALDQRLISFCGAVILAASSLITHHIHHTVAVVYSYCHAHDVLYVPRP